MAHADTRFHAVGQGCFYSGEIYCAPGSEPLRLVYDCGSVTGGGALEREVAELHKTVHEAMLDVLVLSHLDADHVNGLSLLLDNGLTAKNVFLPYLTPVERTICAAGAGDEADPGYFELLSDPVGFLEARGVENIIFINGGTDEPGSSNDQNFPPNQPPGDNDNSPTLSNLENDDEGKLCFNKGEEIESRPSTRKRSSVKMASRKANLYFKTDSKPFWFNRCWLGKFFHRDDMHSMLDAICSSQDFSRRVGDSTSVQRYKRFLAEIRGHFRTLDPARLIKAILNERDRKKLRNSYRHIRGNHNDVSLVLWHGPVQMCAGVRLTVGRIMPGYRQKTMQSASTGGTLLTGDLTCNNQVVARIQRHFGTRLRESTFLQVPHHGSLYSWNPNLLTLTGPDVMPIVSAGRHSGYNHPHPQVVDSLLSTLGPGNWFMSDERNTVAMHVQTT